MMYTINQKTFPDQDQTPPTPTLNLGNGGIEKAVKQRGYEGNPKNPKIRLSNPRKRKARENKNITNQMLPRCVSLSLSG